MAKAAPLTNGDEVEPSTGPLSTEQIVSFKENGCEFCALSAACATFIDGNCPGLHSS